MNINTVVNKINSFFQAIDNKLTKVIPMPAILLLCAALQRRGLSVLTSVSNICKLLEEYGIPTGPNPDGSTNLNVMFVHAVVSEVYRALQEDAVVQGSIRPAEMVLLSNGSNAAGPVVSTGTNILPTHLWGLIE